ncbi:MAG: CHASE4 domain-containing protein [Methanoregulaceae archaeon]
MNLRNKTLLALIITFACFFLLLFAISLTITFSGLNQIETEEGRTGTRQVTAALDAEGNALLGTAQDWSRWDDMNRYILERNPDFVESNLDKNSLANINVNLFLVTDNSGNLIFGKVLSRDLKEDSEIPAPVLSGIRRVPAVTNMSGKKTGVSGIVMLPDGPMLVAVSPILPSNLEGPANGTLVMGRYLDNGILSRITGITGFPVTVLPSGDPAISPSVLSGLSAEEDASIILPENTSVVQGFTLLTGLDGQRFVLETGMPRTLYHSGFAIVNQFFLIFALSAFIITIIVIGIMDRSVLHPLARLTREVRTYENMPDALPAPVLSGTDELAQLEQTIRESHTSLLESENRFRRIVETAQEGIWVMDEKRVTTFVNARMSSMLGFTPEEMTGTPLSRYVPGDEEDTCDTHQATWMQGMSEQFECRLMKKDGSPLRVMLSITPIMNGSGYAGSFAMITDISQRKLTEDALRQATKKLNLLNAITFNDVQNAIFSLTGYLHLGKKYTGEKRDGILDRQAAIVHRISELLEFAKKFQSLGLNPPVWQNVNKSFLLGISHLDISPITRKTAVDHLEIFADPLLEQVFFILAQNVVSHAGSATEVAIRYQETEAGLTLVFEDNGAGIPDDRKEEIFERQYGEKIGQGLFLAKEILGITGITIRETGVYGKGARFEIAVPKGAFRFTSGTS